MLPSKTLERYELVHRIAVGGMAEVYRAVAYGAHGFEKPLAIKRILPELARDPEFEARFINEAKLAVQLTHANVVQVFDFGRTAGTLFIAMEYVDGLDLALLLKHLREHDQKISVSAAFQIAIDIARGLDFAHQQGVVHRDVSPSNILLSRAGEVKIADFGIALAGAQPHGRPSGRRRIMGKWRYMSPEQTRGEPLDTTSDLFSAASVMFELFTGDKLFPGDEADEIIENIHSMTIPKASERRIGLPPRLDEVLARSLERDPGKRPSKPGEIVRALTELSYESSIVATALDVADSVASVLAEQKPGAKSGGGVEAAAGKGIDELIRKQLGGGAVGATRRTAVTGRDPAVGLEDTDLGEVELKGGGTSEATHTATMVKRGVDADGLTLWELDDDREDTIAAVPSAIKFGKSTGSAQAIQIADDDRLVDKDPPRRTGLVAAGVAAIVLAGAVGAWVMAGRADRGSTERPVAEPIDAGVPLPPAGHGSASLRIDSIPPGAKVWIDGTLLPGVTPTTTTVVEKAAHRVELQVQGYERWAIEGVTLRGGDVFPIKPTLVRLRAALAITTVPTGVTAKLGGRILGKTPLDVGDLDPAPPATLLLSKTGYQPIRVKVELVAGKRLEIDRTLKQAVRYGKIHIFINGGWADVYLRGKKVGTAPREAIRLPLGKHTLRLHNPHSGKEKTLQVEVVAGEQKRYRVTW